MKVKINALKSGDNARKEFNKNFLEQMARSIRADGIIQPIIARKDGTIIAGEQRWRAAKIAGLKFLEKNKDVIFCNKASEAGFIENTIRKNLNPFELSDGLYNVLTNKTGMDKPTLKLMAYYAHKKSKAQIREREDEIKSYLKAIDNVGMNHGRSYWLLSLVELSKDARNYALKHLDRLHLSKLYGIAQMPKEYHLAACTATVENNYSKSAVGMLWKRFQTGVMDKNFHFVHGITRAEKLEAEREAGKIKMDARERTIREIETRAADTRKPPEFAWHGFLMDMQLLEDDIRKAAKNLMTFPKEDKVLFMKRLSVIIEEMLVLRKGIEAL